MFVFRRNSRGLKEKVKILMKLLAQYKDPFVDNYRTFAIDLIVGYSLFLTHYCLIMKKHEKTKIKEYFEYFLSLIYGKWLRS